MGSGTERLGPIVDGHFHLWDLERLSYPWLAPDAPPRPFGDHGSIKKTYRPEDYLADWSGPAPAACVHVQANCADPLGETAWLEKCAERTGIPTALVAWCDLTSPTASADLERLAQVPLVRGVRMMLNFHEEPLRRAARQFDLMDDPAFRAGFARLRQHDFVFDLGCLPAQLPLACRLADDHPGTTLILNHLGWPLLDDPDGRDNWRRGIQALARRANVVLKVSGLWPIERNWDPAALRPYVREAVEWFGFERSLYGSNFPVEKLMTTIPHQIAALLEIFDDASASDLDYLFAKTARRVYCLPVTQAGIPH